MMVRMAGGVAQDGRGIQVMGMALCEPNAEKGEC